MEALKQVVEGQILQILIAFNPHQDIMNEGELKDYETLKRCAEILEGK